MIIMIMIMIMIIINIRRNDALVAKDLKTSVHIYNHAKHDNQK